MTMPSDMPSEDKLDPRLIVMLEREETAATAFSESARSVRVGMAEDIDRVSTVDVLVRGRDIPGTAFADLGATVRSVIEGPETIVSVAIDATLLRTLAKQPWVEEIEGARDLYPELDLSLTECRVPAVHGLNPAIRGAGVLIGIIDGGIDFRHDDFRNADGTSRIRLLWDQFDTPDPAGSVPFGRVFTKAQIDAVLANASGTTSIAHTDPGAHGTHVAGIAAGNGLSTNPSRFIGVAPEAELIVVSTRGGGTLGQSNFAISAYSWIVTQAQALGMPVAINQSQGMNGGGHSGESLLEESMDMLARQPGVVIVKSAGNEQLMRIHAGGELVQGDTRVLSFVSGGSNVQDDILELWHDGVDRLSVAVQPPGASSPNAGDFVTPGANSTTTTTAKNQIRIVSTNNAGNTGDVRTTVFVTRGTANRIQPGTWKLHLRADAITESRFDVWIERSGQPRTKEQARFTEPSNDPTRTISIPGTARRIITVGSFVTRGGTIGQISDFSSRGPTRHGLPKPEIAAPGEDIAAARSTAASEFDAPPFENVYTIMPGTSMAAPHVTGAAALLLHVNPSLTCMEAKQILMRAARSTGFASSAPDNTWGAGKLDVAEAVRLGRVAAFATISNVVVNGTQVSWTTNVPTTGAVRFNVQQRRMLLGRATGSLADLTLATQHRVDLAGQPSGRYFCEILAFTQDDWETLADNGGQHFLVVV
jgi:subtilisin family serine protease